MLDSTFDIELTDDELEILVHFATIGQSHVISRNHWGDREVAKELNPVLNRIWQLKRIGFVARGPGRSTHGV